MLDWGTCLSLVHESTTAERYQYRTAPHCNAGQHSDHFAVCMSEYVRMIEPMRRVLTYRVRWPGFYKAMYLLKEEWCMRLLASGPKAGDGSAYTYI